jgi:DNA (cytosine-5)-methyltransferase 1
MPAYYNEFDPYAAQWLRNLIAAGHIAPGDVDERSIVDVQPDDLRGYEQCHFFAGIGGWSLAARLAGYPDDRELWTGSCPCQPFSVAGKGEGQKDERHLWPEFFRLIAARRPPVVMGEQVAAAVGKHWLDGVCADLERINYAARAVVVPACAVDAPHRRDRLWFVADTQRASEGWGQIHGPDEGCSPTGSGAPVEPVGAGPDGPAAYSNGAGVWFEQGRLGGSSRAGARVDSDDRQDGSLANPVGTGLAQRERDTGVLREVGSAPARQDFADDIGTVGDADIVSEGQGREQRGGQLSGGGDQERCNWIVGADGKARRVEPGIRLLAHGVPARVGKLRAFGNAIVPQLAAEVIGAYLDATAERVRLEGVFA